MGLGLYRVSVRVANYISPIGNLKIEEAVINIVVRLNAVELNNGFLTGAVDHL